MGATQKGFLALALEPSSFPGRQLLMPETAIGATMSLTTQPSAISASGLMFLLIIVKGATASGTVTATGKKADGTTVVAETSPTLPAATTTLPQVAYATIATYNSVNASGITTTGLTNATVTIYGILAATKLIPVDFSSKVAYDQFSPQDHRGILYGHFRIQQMNKHVTLDKFDSGFYPETDLFWPHATFSNAPTVTTIPATPTTKLASTAVSGSPLSLTTQPVAPGEMFSFTITGTSVAGTITVSGGTNQFGQATTEVIACSGNGTFYSQNVYSAVPASGIVISGLTSGSVAIGGFFATKWVFLLPGAALATLAGALFSGTDSSVFPFTYFEEGVFDMDVSKEIKLTGKVMSQDKVILGDRTTAPMNASRLPTYGQPYDMPVVGWPALIYIDSLSGTPFTTLYNDLLTFKLTVDTGLKNTNTATNKQVFDRVYQDGTAVLVKFEGLVDFTNVAQFEQFAQNQKQLFGVKFQDPKQWLGNNAGTPLFKYWQFTLPAKYQTYDEDRSKEMVQAKIAGLCEYEPSLGYAARLEIVNQASPAYASL